MPEKIMAEIKNRIKPQWKVCFFAALLIGFLAHFYKITNWLPNWDSLVFRYDSQNMIGLGRWFLPVVCSATSFFDLPFLNGLICILLHSVGAVVICEMMKVKKNTTAFLTGAVVVSFPTVVSVLMYNYVADGYALSFFISCLAAELMTREKPKYILSAILIALSVGIYQAYVTVTILLIVMFLWDKAFFSEEKISAILIKGIKCLACGAAGMVLYYGILKILLAVSGETLLEYQGINSAASMSSFNIAASLYTIKETFLNFFFGTGGGISMFLLINILIFILTVVFYIRYSFSKNGKKPVVNLLVSAVSFVLLVVGSTALAFVNAETDYHNLMIMGYCIFYLIFIMLYERGEEKKDGVKLLKSWTVLVISLVLVINQVVIANVCYHKAQMAYEKTMGTLIRICDRIEQTEGADNCERIMVLGALENSEHYSVMLSPDMTGITDGLIIRADDEVVAQSVFTSALNDYCDKNYTFVSGAEKRKLSADEEIKNMKAWPESGCVFVKNDIVVVKLGAEEDK